MYNQVCAILSISSATEKLLLTRGSIKEGSLSSFTVGKNVNVIVLLRHDSSEVLHMFSYM